MAALAISNAELFVYAQTTYPTVFAGPAIAGTYLQYNFNYYTDSQNYLAVDNNAHIFMRGPFTNGVISDVGAVADYQNAFRRFLAFAGNAEIPAFPEAQGGGASSIGGRGGVIIEVTNLNDSGPGSLRACVKASGPRTCVFRVSGDIKLKSELRVNNPYLTVAGQTSPGGGIQISGLNMTTGVLVGITTHDVIWRYTRNRQGYNKNCKSLSCGSNFAVYSGYNVMIDHNDSQWNIDEGFVAWQTYAYSGTRLNNITFSWNLGAEGLSPHSTASITGSKTNTQSDLMTNIDWHHNLFMNDSDRNPLIKNKSARYVNNLHYNVAYAFSAFDGGILADVIGNSYKKGPLTNSSTYEIVAGFENPTTATGNPSLYLSGNLGYHLTDLSGDQWAMAQQGESCCPIGPVPDEWRRYNNPREVDQAFPINAESVTGLEASVLPLVGASRRLDCAGNWVLNRDSQERRLITQYTNNTGITSLPITENDADGFPVIAPGIACADTDYDGMPDDWETANGLNTNLADDRNYIDPSNGYTNVENYLNGVGANTLNEQTECVFDWAEINYSNMFSPAGTVATQFSSPYSYRAYPTNFKLGVSLTNNHVYYMEQNTTLHDVGPLADWATKAGCRNPVLLH